MKIKKIIGSLVVCFIFGGCSSSYNTSKVSSKSYCVPQAHIEIHRKLLSEQKQLVISTNQEHQND